MIRFFSFAKYHGRQGIGSTRLRVQNLIKYWPEADEYKYGENPDVLIFQKVYTTQDYKFHKMFKNLKILDICDADWVDGVSLKETLDNVDGVTCPTEPLKEFLTQMTDKPIKVIPDRHDIELVPSLRQHKGKPKWAVWFGYVHNAELLRFAVPSLEARGIGLKVISDGNPQAWKWATDPEKYAKNYDYVKYNEDWFYKDVWADFCILPAGNRPQDKYKSNNRVTKSWLAGLPVVTDAESLEKAMNPTWRNEEAKRNYDSAIIEYDVKRSVEEMKQFIAQLQQKANKK